MISLCMNVFDLRCPLHFSNIIHASTFAFSRYTGKEEDLHVCRNKGQLLLTEASISIQEDFTATCIRKNNGKMLSLGPKVFPRLPWG